MASNQPHTKRDAGGQGDKGQGKGNDKGNAPKDAPHKGDKGGGAKGKNDSGGKR